MCNGNSMIEQQDAEEQNDFWNTRERRGHEPEEASETVQWYEGRSITPIKVQPRADESRSKFIYDETLPF